jgi:hypothetical protein
MTKVLSHQLDCDCIKSGHTWVSTLREKEVLMLLVKFGQPFKGQCEATRTKLMSFP